MRTHLNDKEIINGQDTRAGNFIRVDEIKVRCNIPIGQLKDLSIRERMGTHTVVQLTAGIRPMEVENSGMQLAGQPLGIEAVVDGERVLLFSGIISEIHTDREASYETISITAYSLSWLMDLEKKSRSWQGEHSVLDLIQKICREHSFSIQCSVQDKKTEAPFIQYRESDWEFLKRLSTHLQVPVYARGDYAGKGLCLGIPDQEKPIKLGALREKWCMDAERAREMNFDAGMAVYHEVMTGQILHLGKSVLHNREVLRVFEADMILKHGMVYGTYRLAGPGYFAMQTVYNSYLKGISLEGTVLKRKDETLKIHLDIDGEKECAPAYDYPWMPEHGNLVYCMPEEGSRIRLLVFGEDEREAIGIHCVRQNGAVCGETQIPDNRWFSTSQNKKLTLQPALVELSGEEGRSTITFGDNTGSSIRSGGEVLIQAKGQIVMQGTEVVLNAPSEITAVRREVGEPAVVNICHNLDAMGKKTTFRNLEELQIQSEPTRRRSDEREQTPLEKIMGGKKDEKEKKEFELQKLLEQESERNDFELRESVVKIISAIPQYTGQDKIARIAAGARPIAGRMKGK